VTDIEDTGVMMRAIPPFHSARAMRDTMPFTLLFVASFFTCLLYIHDVLALLYPCIRYWKDGWDTLTMPFYKLSTRPSDSASVTIQEAGHYCLSMIEGDPSKLLPIIYDASKVFGEDTMMLRPIEMQNKTVGEILKEKQCGFAKTSSAFSAVDNVVIAPNKTLTITTYMGKADDIMITPRGFSQYKLSRARELIKQITASVETDTGHHLFNGHVQQMHLDSSLPGGIPIILGEVDDDAKMRNVDEGTSRSRSYYCRQMFFFRFSRSSRNTDERLKVYHLFSHIHGDLERDYNDFVIDPTYFSQGPGNFRDVAQVRPENVCLHSVILYANTLTSRTLPESKKRRDPRIASFNVRMFLSFIQPDGYEPLSVEAVAFSTIKDQQVWTNASLCEGFS